MSVCKVNTLAEVGRFLELEYRVYDGISHWVPGQKKDITRIITGKLHLLLISISKLRLCEKKLTALKGAVCH